MKNDTYIITGAAGAIGRVVAMSFVEAGAKVVLVDRDEKLLEQVAASIGGAISLTCDLTDAAAVQTMVEDAVIRAGSIQGLIQVAGGFTFANVVDTVPEDFDRMVNINFRSTYNAALAVSSVLKNQGRGFIAGFAAGPALERGAAGTALYGGAKAAVATFLQSLAAELKADGVGVSILYPMGIVDTPTNRKDMPDADPAEWIDPRDIGRALVFAAGMAPSRSIIELPVYPPV